MIAPVNPPRSLKPAIFLDRDDTLIANHAIRNRMEHPGYLYRPDLVELLPKAGEGSARFRDAGFLLVVVTNQSSVARGWCTVADVEHTHARLRELLVPYQVTLAGIYTALHSPDATLPALATDHPWRKPGGAMLTAAASDLAIDLSRSWLIGDAQRDLDAAAAAGISPSRVLIVGDHAFPSQPARPGTFAARVTDLDAAASYVLSAAAPVFQS